ncbi:PREDICTED: putative disease resistance RPP13-like protein 2 [Camelina sativa]|uniref:Disease resistance RPP13-like protein 2 n=1 Tax=Camelina sativa TaxID=90675 RepID=A0ABM0TGK0_CAMSA|nr:PREDICTED: putative disease resistance RPP13-like protein 2 [Camelina sativa]
MVDAITEFVVGKIDNYLIEEASMLMGVKDDLEELKTELTCIQIYLKDVEARDREDENSKEWAQQVLDIAYGVEDVLDTYFLKLEKRPQRLGLMRLTNIRGEKNDAYNIVDDIRTLKRRMLDLTCKRETYAIRNFNEHRAVASTQRVKELRRARTDDQEECVVGFADDAKVLLTKLLDDDGDNKTYMIFIFGMGGLGKTTLARKLYNSSDVKEKFEYRVWTNVSRECKTRDILMRIIRSLGEEASEVELEKMAEEELEFYLHDILQEKRYMVVVDDIWERETWESLKRALPYNDEGSRVIITTRIRAMAEGADQRVYAHYLRFLTFEESWNLFERKAFRDIKKVDQELQNIGKEMVQKCGGLQLSTIVLAGLMSRKRPNEWNDVWASLCIKDDTIHVSTLFDLSFKEMGNELKLCFLYLSVFPEDYEIDVERFIQLLVAEGFIQVDEEMMMEDVARYYIEELIDRSLVQVVERQREKLMFCRVHDLIRELAIKKAKELNFVNVYNEQHSSTTTWRREVVHQLMDNNYLCDRRVNKHMRSFLFFGEPRRDITYVETITLKLKLLRVLNLGGLHFICQGYSPWSLPDVIGGLVHLRYLGIADTVVNNLPDFISSLRFLQTLDASGNCFEQMTDLSKLISLRHVTGRFIGELLIGDAVNLQTLRSISTYSWSKLKHELLINLRDLEIYEFHILRDQRRVPLDLVSLSKLKNLRILKIEVLSFSLFSEETVRFELLVELTLHCSVQRLPIDMDMIFPSLESLKLIVNLQEDPMPALQKLQRLEDLVLYSSGYPGAKICIKAQGFFRMRKLVLIMKRLDELEIEDEAMPSLMELNLDNKGGATKLMIPDRLRAFI